LDPPEVVAGLLAQRRAEPEHEQVTEGAYLAKRLLEVVGGDVGELLQLTVCTLEFRRIHRQLFLGALARGDVPNERAEGLLLPDAERPGRHFHRELVPVTVEGEELDRAAGTARSSRRPERRGRRPQPS
jgi:hypothetical protein